MNEIIYLEPDEDITGVIAKVKETAGNAISLVIPRGGTLAQSVVNLKLMKREIEKLDKSLSLVTKDKISKNLASQVGVTVYPSISEAKNSRAKNPEPVSKDSENKPDGFETTGLKINQYSREEAAAEEEVAPEAEEISEEGVEAPDNPEAIPEEDPEVIERVKAPKEEEAEEDDERSRIAEERNRLAHAQPIPKTRKDIEPESPAPEKPKHNVSSRRKPLIIIGSILLIIILAGGAVLYPSASVKMTLATEDIELKPEITADKQLTAVNIEEMQLPLKEYVIEKNVSDRDFPTTGKKDVGEKASGTITFYNNIDPNNPINLPNGTVLTASGKTFLLDGAITIPVAHVVLFPVFSVTPGQTTGKIIAKDSGESSNIGASKFLISSFSGTKQEKVYGQSTTALTGGTTRELKIVSSDDISAAKKSLGEELVNAAKEELLKRANDDSLKLVVSSISKEDVEYSTTKEAGAEAETFKATIKIRLKELAYSESDLKKLVFDKAKAGLKNDEMMVSSTEEDVTYDLVKVDAEKGQISINASFKGKVGKKFDAGNIQKELVKSKYGNAESKLKAMDGVKDASINVTPSFWPLLPFLAQRINVGFDYQK